MTTVATNSHAISPLVTADEDLFATLTGKPLSDNATISAAKAKQTAVQASAITGGA